MDLKLNGMTAPVTGGSEGIDTGIAFALAQESVDVALAATAKEIAAATGRKIVPIAADLRQDADAKNFVEQAATALGRIDIMIETSDSGPGAAPQFRSHRECHDVIRRPRARSAMPGAGRLPPDCHQEAASNTLRASTSMS